MILSNDNKFSIGSMQAAITLSSLMTSQKRTLNNIAELAAQIGQTRFAAIAVYVNEQLTIVSKVGYDFDDSLTDLLSVLDQHTTALNKLNENETIKNHPLINGYPNLRYISCTPVYINQNTLLGYIVIMDDQPRQLAEAQETGVHLLAQQLETIYHLEAQSANSKAKIHGITDHMSAVFCKAMDAVVIMDEDGVVLRWNPKAEALYGWTAGEAVGKVFYQTFLSQHYHATWLEIINQANIDNNTASTNKPVEIAALHKSGTEFEIALGISSAIIDGQLFYIAFISDITDRKLVSTELSKQKAFYENILNKLPADIAVFDANHRYLFVNPGAISNEEYRKYIIGKDDYQYVAYRNRDISVAHSRREKFLQAKNSGREILWEEGMKNPQGQVVTSLRRMFPVYDNAGELTMVIGFGVDITDRKVMEEKQELLVKQLSAQNAQLIDFCNIVSHNLRGPLVNMSMLVEYIEQSKEEVERKFLISKLPPVLDNLHATFNELVESIQIKQNLEIKSERLDLYTYVQRTIETLQTEIDKLQAVIEIDFNDAPIIYFPPKYLLSICHNLISNALKYHSPKRRPVITLQTKRKDDAIIFSVKDNGLGIDIDKHKNNLFKIGKVFHRHPNSKGFGLYMTKTQIEAMGGDIRVESTLDEGTCFSVVFRNQEI